MSYGTAYDGSDFWEADGTKTPVNWRILPGVDLIIVGATAGWGKLFEDKEFSMHWKNARRWGYHRAAYGWYYPTHTPQECAQFLYDTLQRNGYLETDGIPWIDAEENLGYSKKDYLYGLQKCLAIADELFRTRVGAYTARWFMVGRLGCTAEDLRFLNSRPVWLAGYPFKRDKEIPPDYVPPDDIESEVQRLGYDLPGVSRVDIWQWAETLKVPGLVDNKTGTDANCITNSLEYLWNLTGRQLRTDLGYRARRKIHEMQGRYDHNPFLERRT